MGKTGFGRSGVFSAMFSFDGSLKPVPDYDFIAYPPPGLMPIEYFGPRHAWNVSFHGQKYQLADKTAVRTRVCELDALFNKVGAPLKLDFENVDATPIGVANCVIFRPADLVLAPGRRYLVEIDGLSRKDNKTAAAPRFVVEFCTLNP